MQERTGLATGLLILLASLAALPSPAQPSRPVVRVGIVFDGPWSGNAEIRSLTRTEIVALTERDFEVRFPEAKTLTGDWTFEAARDAVEALLIDPEVDLLIAWGVLASHAVCCIDAPDKPVIAPLVIDVDLQGIPHDQGTSGVRNLSYVTFQDKTTEELRTFRDIVPFDKLIFVAQRGIVDAIPELPERTRELVRSLGIQASYVPVDDRVDDVLARIPPDTEAVYLWPQFQLEQEQVERLVQGLEQRGLPTFSALVDPSFEAGALATMASEDFFPRLTRRIALNAQSILLGTEAGRLPVELDVRGRLTINLATAQAIEVSPRWELLIEADLIGDQSLEGFQAIHFDQAVREAVEVNLDVLAEERAVAAGAQDPVRARAAWRPRLDASASGLTIDDDRAGAAQAERTVTGRLALSQVVFDDQVLANIEIQDQLQIGREAALEQLRLDVALDAATAYLNLLRAVSLSEVQRSNLALTRSNLERAELRRSVGAANPAEVFRWRSQIANDRRALIDAMASIHQAEITLSRLLDRDLEIRYRAAEVDLTDPLLITGEARFDGYIETPRHFRTLSDFMVQEGSAIAPELEQLRASIAAQRRQISAARRAFYLPQVTFQAVFDELLTDGGVGSNPSTPGLPDDTSWSLTLGASLPLYSGGTRRADQIQAEETLTQLEHQLEATSDRVEQRIRSAMVAARASFAAIELTEEAAEAAGQNLELVADSYSRGAVSIIDLLDAQNAALSADQAVANAGHDFLIDLMELQRAANQFDFFTSPVARDAWFERLDRYFADRGVAPWPRAPQGE